MAATKVAHKTANAITFLIEVQRWLRITMSVILWPPALRATMTDSQT
ncbi:MAG TPA: hypothetical protein VGR97_11885 [Candidatus Acidoferrales bacterium]|nr:hypothetical protein [Candidatus Acidoferrales bacterium]